MEALRLECKLKDSKKKGKSGVLVLTPEHLLFTVGGSDRPRLTLPLASVTDLQVAKGDAVFMMKVLSDDAARLCVLTFRSKSDLTAAQAKLTELRAALRRPAEAAPPIVLSGAARGEYLSKDRALKERYKEMVAEGSLRDEEFWKDEELQRRLAVEQAEGGSTAVLGHRPAARDGDGGGAEEGQGMVMEKDMSEHVFVTQPEVYAEYLAAVPSGRMTEEQFWAKFLRNKQAETARGGAPASGAAGAAGGGGGGGGAAAAAGAGGEFGSADGETLLGILRGASADERALHRRRMAEGRPTDRAPAEESRPTDLGPQRPSEPSPSPTPDTEAELPVVAIPSNDDRPSPSTQPRADGGAGEPRPAKRPRRAQEESSWREDAAGWRPSSAHAVQQQRRRLDERRGANPGGTTLAPEPGPRTPAEEQYTSELKRAFQLSTQYLRHFWSAIRKQDREKAARMRTTLQQLHDTIATQNGRLGRTERRRLVPLSHHLQHEMLKTALNVRAPP